MIMLYSGKQSLESIKDRLDVMKIIGEKNTHIDMEELFDFFQKQTKNSTNVDEITDFDSYLYTIKDGEKIKNNLSEYMFDYFLDAYNKKPQQLLLKSLVNYVATREPIDGTPQIK
jgi:glycyl-tRNA synthetase beta subunit